MGRDEQPPGHMSFARSQRGSDEAQFPPLVVASSRAPASNRATFFFTAPARELEEEAPAKKCRFTIEFDTGDVRTYDFQSAKKLMILSTTLGQEIRVKVREPFAQLLVGTRVWHPSCLFGVVKAVQGFSGTLRRAVDQHPRRLGHFRGQGFVSDDHHEEEDNDGECHSQQIEEIVPSRLAKLPSSAVRHSSGRWECVSRLVFRLVCRHV